MHEYVVLCYSIFILISDLQTQLNLQNMDSCFIGIICSSFNTDATTMVRALHWYL